MNTRKIIALTRWTFVGKVMSLFFNILSRFLIWAGNGTPLQVLLPGKSHGRRSLVGCSPWGRKELNTTERLHFHFSLSYIGEGNGNPLQCSCLENPRDGGAWWAAVYGVAQSLTWLMRLSSSRFLIAFLPRSKCLSISWLQWPSAVILEPPKIKSDTVSIVSPSIYNEVMRPDAMILVFWLLSFKPTFSLLFHFHQEALYSSLLSAIRVVSSAYLRLLIFLMAILIPACALPSQAFRMMYFAYKFKKQGDSIQPWCTPFPIWN